MAFSYNKNMDYKSVKAYAKINLSLNIVEKNGGYHMLDSVCTTVSKYDVITIKKRNDNKINVRLLGRYAKTNYIQSNLNAYKAAELFMKKYSTCGVDVDIERNIPTGSGMGGSSADISGVLKCMKGLFNIDDDMCEIANNLGSDAGYLLNDGFARLKCRGDKFELLDIDYKLYFLVIYANDGVNTVECFKKYDEQCNSKSINNNDKIVELLKNKTISGLKELCVNDLLNSACQINKEVVTNYKALNEITTNYVGMTGSGATVFVLYESIDDAIIDYNKLKPKYDNNIEILSSYYSKHSK